MSWLPLTALLLIALWAAYVAGRDKGRAEGMVAGLLIAQEDDPLRDFVNDQREAAREGAQ